MPGINTFLISFAFLMIFQQQNVFVPVNISDRKNTTQITLTEIGKFGVLRKARTNVPAHLHTGIDIKRPKNNYDNEPVFPIAEGKVISKRTDGAYAQIIIEHHINDKTVWSLYEHVAGIKVNVNDIADPQKPIAYFMSKQELNKYGWQFDHFHLEILKTKPLKLSPRKGQPQRFYNSYSLSCYTKEDLLKHYYDPLEFLRTHVHK